MKINKCINKKLSICLVLLSVTMIFSACAKYSSPSSLLKPPQISIEQIKGDIKENVEINIEDVAAEVDCKKVVEEFFHSKNLKLLSPDRIVSKKSLYSMDLDGDNIEEIFGFLEDDEELKIHFFILQKINNSWTSKYTCDINGTRISYIDTAKIYNEEQISLIIGVLVSDYIGSEYSMFTLRNENQVMYVMSIGMWNKFEVLNDFSHDNNKGFILERGIGREEIFIVLT